MLNIARQLAESTVSIANVLVNSKEHQQALPAVYSLVRRNCSTRRSEGLVILFSEWLYEVLGTITHESRSVFVAGCAADEEAAAANGWAAHPPAPRARRRRRCRCRCRRARARTRTRTRCVCSRSPHRPDSPGVGASARVLGVSVVGLHVGYLRVRSTPPGSGRDPAGFPSAAACELDSQMASRSLSSC